MAKISAEKLAEMHKDMVDSNVLYSVIAKKNEVNPSTFYGMLKKAGLSVNVGRRGRPRKQVESKEV